MTFKFDLSDTDLIVLTKALQIAATELQNRATDINTSAASRRQLSDEVDAMDSLHNLFLTLLDN